MEAPAGKADALAARTRDLLNASGREPFDPIPASGFIVIRDRHSLVDSYEHTGRNIPAMLLVKTILFLTPKAGNI